MPLRNYLPNSTNMRLSQLFTKTIRDVSEDEVSKNARLLIRAGYINKLTAGVYTYLPLGLRVLNKVMRIVREEINGIGGQEVLMPALQPKQLWEQTQRWDNFDALFKVQSRWGAWEYGLGPTHEEVVVPLVKQFVQSYRHLPVSVYQIQTKFRDEARAKSGILRGREFIMKDLYSFHADEEDRANYYEKCIAAYNNIFQRAGFKDILKTEASGGSFSTKFSHEFQAVCDAGEDVVVFCAACKWAQNVEITQKKAGEACPNGDGTLQEAKTIEVGNIFDLGVKFSEAFDVKYKDKNGESKPVIIGCYGIGISRMVGTLVEQHGDEKGLVWPASVAPYAAHIVPLGKKEEVKARAETLYHALSKAGVEAIIDDREASNGEKLSDADLLGMPVRLIVSEKTGEKVEWKNRAAGEAVLLTHEEALTRLIQ